MTAPPFAPHADCTVRVTFGSSVPSNSNLEPFLFIYDEDKTITVDWGDEYFVSRWKPSEPLFAYVTQRSSVTSFGQTYNYTPLDGFTAYTVKLLDDGSWRWHYSEFDITVTFTPNAVSGVVESMFAYKQGKLRHKRHRFPTDHVANPDISLNPVNVNRYHGLSPISTSVTDADVGEYDQYPKVSLGLNTNFLTFGNRTCVICTPTDSLEYAAGYQPSLTSTSPNMFDVTDSSTKTVFGSSYAVVPFKFDSYGQLGSQDYGPPVCALNSRWGKQTGDACRVDDTLFLVAACRHKNDNETSYSVGVGIDFILYTIDHTSLRVTETQRVSWVPSDMRVHDSFDSELKITKIDGGFICCFIGGFFTRTVPSVSEPYNNIVDDVHSAPTQVTQAPVAMFIPFENGSLGAPFEPEIVLWPYTSSLPNFYGSALFTASNGHAVWCGPFDNNTDFGRTSSAIVIKWDGTRLVTKRTVLWESPGAFTARKTGVWGDWGVDYPEHINDYSTSRHPVEWFESKLLAAKSGPSPLYAQLPGTSKFVSSITLYGSSLYKEILHPKEQVNVFVVNNDMSVSVDQSKFFYGSNRVSTGVNDNSFIMLKDYDYGSSLYGFLERYSLTPNLNVQYCGAIPSDSGGG